jgi:hypothetical protein
VSEAFKFCPECGTENTEGRPFCSNCGFGSSSQETLKSDAGSPDSPVPEVGIQNEAETASASSGSFEISSSNLEVAQYFISSINEELLRGRKRRKWLSRNYPDCDVGSIGLTPYGLAIMTCVLFCQEVSREPVKFANYFDCEPELLIECSVAAIQDQVFEGTSADVPAFQLEKCNNYPVGCGLSAEHFTPTDMVLHLLRLLTAYGSYKFDAPEQKHDENHRIAAFTQYGMGCSTFRPSVSSGSVLMEDMQLLLWFSGTLTGWDSVAAGGNGFFRGSVVDDAEMWE